MRQAIARRMAQSKREILHFYLTIEVDMTEAQRLRQSLNEALVDNFQAIINPPQVAILALGSVKSRPVVKEGEITIAEMMNATLSCDHRVTDGAQAAQFMQEFKGSLESPLRLLL